MSSALVMRNGFPLLIRQAVDLSKNASSVNATADGGCQIDTCAIETSHYDYRISLIATLALIALFGGFTLNHIATFAITKRALAFNLLMVIGTSTELLGYIGRLFSWYNQWTEWPYLMQMIVLTIAPTFMSAAIYLCFRRLVIVFGEDHSTINPNLYARVFIPSDICALILQAVGGGIMAVALRNGDEPRLGTNIMLAGLCLQALALGAFMILCIIFMWNCWMQRRFDRVYSGLRANWRFRCFVLALAHGTACILGRCVYRVVQLIQGWDGELSRNQLLFILLDGAMVAVACLGLNLFNPSLVFPDDRGWDLGGEKETGYLSRSPTPEKSLLSESASEIEVEQEKRYQRTP